MSLARSVLRLMVRLPDRWLVRLAGGVPLVVEGRTLDPACQLLTVQAKRRERATDIEAIRREANEALALLAGGLQPGVAIEPGEIPTPAGAIPMRLYRPDGLAAPAPLALFFHQGGFVLGTLDWSESFLTLLADRARCLVVNVDYRLAPEHRFPAAAEDAQAAWRWATANAAGLGGDPARIAVGGDSAGGNLAAVLAHETKRAGGIQPILQLLVYPWVEGRAETRSYEAFADAWPLDRPLMDWFTEQALAKPSDIDDPRLNPLREPDFAGLPPALVHTAGFDPLSDEGAAYADKLVAAGVPVSHRCWDSLPHSFLAMGAVPAARRAQEEIAEQVRRALQEA